MTLYGLSEIMAITAVAMESGVMLQHPLLAVGLGCLSYLLICVISMLCFRHAIMRRTVRISTVGGRHVFCISPQCAGRLLVKRHVLAHWAN